MEIEGAVVFQREIVFSTQPVELTFNLQQLCLQVCQHFHFFSFKSLMDEQGEPEKILTFKIYSNKSALRTCMSQNSSLKPKD